MIADGVKRIFAILLLALFYEYLGWSRLVASYQPIHHLNKE